MAAGSWLVVFAGDAPATPAAGTSPAVSTPSTASSTDEAENTQMQADNDLRVLELILSLPRERLTALRKAIENVEKKSQAERDQLKRDIQLRHQNLNQLLHDISGDLQKLSPADRSVIFQYLPHLFTDELQALQDRFHKAETPDARKAIVEELLKTATSKGFKPEASERGQPGGRGNNAGTGRGGRNGQNGPGGPRGGPPRAPMPEPTPASK